MKNLLVSILCIAFVLLSSKEWVAITSFKWNQEEIAQNFCVNKFKEGSCCEGSCFLTGLLIDMHDERETPQLILEWERMPLFIQETSYEGFFNLSMSAEEIPYVSRAQKSDYTYSLLDPPRLV